MRTRVIIGVAILLGVALLILLLWPPADPLSGVETVAIRVGTEPPSQSAFDFESELGVILGGRNIRIVSDEASADLVLALDDFRVNLGDIELSLTSGSLRGEASAVCLVTELDTGRTYTMDFVIRVEDGRVEADLMGRRFWEFWK